MTQTIVLQKLKCLRCGHEWFPRTEKQPLRCAFCKSVYWNIPRRTQNQT